MKKAFYISVLFSMFSLTSCNETDMVAEMLLYGESGNNANFSFSMTYASYFPFEDITTHGLDISITNNSEDPLTDVSVSIIEVNPFSDWSDYSSDSRLIGTIAPGSTSEPENYWCYNCNTIDEVYIGHFWVDTYSYISSGNNMEVVFSIEYSYNGDVNTIEQTRSFSTNKKGMIIESDRVKCKVQPT